MADNQQRPVVTFALIAYNQEHYVAEAIAAAFGQTYSPLEIILSDDASSDSTFEIMQRAAANYNGPHHVVLNRNPSNLNIGGHVNAVAQIATGELIVLAAGDDISIPSRVKQLVQHWDALGRPSAVLCSDFEPIDFTSKPVTLNGESLYRGPFSIQSMARGEIRVLGATTAVSKDVFSSFPPLNSSVRHEDKVLPFRALLLGGAVVLINEKLVQYRIEGGISRGKVKSGKDYLYREVSTFAERTLPDAVQRLTDLIFISPGNAALHNECVLTISDLQSCIELTKARGFDIDVCMLKWLRKGARPGALLKLYLKLRFFIFFNLYYQIRFVK